MNDVMPTLWVTGAPGAGKSTVGWKLFGQIAAHGGSVAYLDIDQLGLLGPPPGGGDRGHRIKSDNLIPLLHGLRDFGVRQTIISGVVDPERGLEYYLRTGPRLEGVDLDLVRLSCSFEVLCERFLGRGSSADLLDELQKYVRLLDSTDIGESVDTTHHTPDQTVAGLLGRCLIAAPRAGATPVCAQTSIPVAAVTGPTAVGKSTAGWHALQTLWQQGLTTAFVDAQQLSFVHPPPPDAFVQSQISALVHGYERAGATAALLVARDPTIARTWSGGPPGVVVRLGADRASLQERVESRGRGLSALLAGDELRGAPSPARRAVLDRALQEAEDFARDHPDLPVLDSSHQTAEETAAMLLEHLRPALVSPRC
ncbi:hypothetical protein [Pseudonocardia alni]|uniref:hypothetical protein n=1 Tax=Pseudonocardia alni TaxID=33907 RepID=UPI00280BFF9C|nr:hypothetical protein [Pseudonocardia alni]